MTSVVSFGSDGASWAKKAFEYFPGAVFVLDPYHLKKHLVEALHHDEEALSLGKRSDLSRKLGRDID